MFYLFIFREKEREGNINQLPLPSPPQLGTCAQPRHALRLGLELVTLWSTEPHQPGPGLYFKCPLSNIHIVLPLDWTLNDPKAE